MLKPTGDTKCAKCGKPGKVQQSLLGEPLCDACIEVAKELDIDFSTDEVEG